MRQYGVDFGGAGLHQLVGGQADRSARVCHVVNLEHIRELFSDLFSTCYWLSEI